MMLAVSMTLFLRFLFRNSNRDFLDATIVSLLGQGYAFYFDHTWGVRKFSFNFYFVIPFVFFKTTLCFFPMECLIHNFVFFNFLSYFAFRTRFMCKQNNLTTVDNGVQPVQKLGLILLFVFWLNLKSLILSHKKFLNVAGLIWHQLLQRFGN